MIELGMKFNSLSEFKMAVKDYNIHLGREVKWKKNDSIRAMAACKDGCPWEITCLLHNASKTFQVVKFVDVHTCSRSFKNKQASTKWVTKKLVQEVREKPNLTSEGAFYHMKCKYNVHVPDATIFRAMKEARKIVMGS